MGEKATGARGQTGQALRATISGMQGSWLADSPTLCALTGEPYGYSCMSGGAVTVTQHTVTRHAHCIYH